jgi:hypothetical protein
VYRDKVIYHLILHVVTVFLVAHSHLHPFVTEQCSCIFSPLTCLLANDSTGRHKVFLLTE